MHYPNRKRTWKEIVVGRYKIFSCNVNITIAITKKIEIVYWKMPTEKTKWNLKLLKQSLKVNSELTDNVVI